MNASNKLIEELDFSDAIDENLPEKIEQAENDKDQMIELITNTFYNTYEYLNKTNRGSVSVLVLAGSWVEALYIAMHISEDTYNNVEMVKIVMDQKEPLQKLMDLIAEHGSSEAVTETGTLLTPIHTLYQNLDEGSISQSQMEAIAAEVARVRAEIVN
jgi:D-arabinose 1-dehydrogenase-like Zn-dependent alcohol dehydrogenase